MKAIKEYFDLAIVLAGMAAVFLLAVNPQPVFSLLFDVFGW